MIDLTKIKEIYLFTGTTDFRQGITGLTKIVLNKFEQKKTNQNLYIFCSKNGKSLKAIEFDETGIWLYHKKLEVGKFIYPKQGTIGKITTDNLKVLINGLDFVYKIEGLTDQKYDYY